MMQDELTDGQIDTLDYILNYDSGERVLHNLTEKELAAVDDIIERRKERDDYSNTYEVLEIPDEHQADVKDAIGTAFEGFREDRLRQIFETQTNDAFQFYNDVAHQDQDVIKPTERKYDNLGYLLERLKGTGYGVIQHYLTTTNNRYLYFSFRDFPADGVDAFEQTAEEIVRENLQSLSQSEMWAAYLNAYLDPSEPLRNLGGFPSHKIKTALENSQVTAKENISFLNEQMKEFLQTRLIDAIQQDHFYLTLLEFLKAGSSPHSTTGRLFSKETLAAIDETRKKELQPYVEQLINKGLILEKSDSYLLTEELLAVLAEVEERTKIESYAIRSLSQAQSRLYDILSAADEEIKIIDRFFDGDALRLIDQNAPNDIRILILYSKDSVEQSLEAELAVDLIDEAKYRIKKMTSLSDGGLPHDRFLIVDNRTVWQVGHSFNGLGNDFSTIFSHSEDNTEEYVTVFDDLWQTGDEFHTP